MSYKERFVLNIDDSVVEHNHVHTNDFFEKYKNEFDEESQGIIANQQSSLQNTILGIESRLVSSVINKVSNLSYEIYRTKNNFEEQQDIITDGEKKKSEEELRIQLKGFYLIIIPLFAGYLMNTRRHEFGFDGDFKLNNYVRSYINDMSSKVSQSHINTIVNDLLKVTKQSYQDALDNQLEAIKSTGRKVTDADLVHAREMALKGDSQQQIIRSIKTNYNDNISKTRVKAIARTETNRAFIQSQYQSDLQFIKQNKLEGKAYKKWITRSDNPCANCIDLASEPPIPFETNFRDLGDIIKTTINDGEKTKIKKLAINFEPLSAGNAHVNCACIYKLIIIE